jgi:hypothetical protein
VGTGGQRAADSWQQAELGTGKKVSVFSFQLLCFFFLTPETQKFGSWDLKFQILDHFKHVSSF